jgi:RHS repeat-associated protein
MVLDHTGSLANMKRHDYLPFGEELLAPAGGRSAAQGYSGGDGVRQQFTSQERDVETGLDYFNARYYSPTQGRFVSADSVPGSIGNPQTLNLYSYVKNNPFRFIDPSGNSASDLERPPGLCGPGCQDPKEPQVIKKPFVPEGDPAFNPMADILDGPIIVKDPGGPIETSTDTPLAELPPSKLDWLPVVGNARHFLYNYHTHNFEGAMGYFVLMALDLTPVGNIGRGAKLTTLALENRKAGFDLALGLAKYADDLAAKTGSLTYREAIGDATFSPENFTALANQARTIRFTTEAFDWHRWGRWVTTNPDDWSPYLDKVTNWELHQVLTNPEWLAKTVFY